MTFTIPIEWLYLLGFGFICAILAFWAALVMCGKV